MHKTFFRARLYLALGLISGVGLSCSSGGGDGGKTDWDLAGDWVSVSTITSDPCDQMEDSTGPVRITQSGTHLTVIDQFGIAIEGSIEGDHITAHSESKLAGIDCTLHGEYNAVIWDQDHISGSANFWWTGDDCGLLAQCTATSTFDLTRD